MPDPAEALPPKPLAPEPGDCCGGGCALCVLDLYQQELAKWEERVAEMRRAQNATSTDGPS